MQDIKRSRSRSPAPGKERRSDRELDRERFSGGGYRGRYGGGQYGGRGRERYSPAR